MFGNMRFAALIVLGHVVIAPLFVVIAPDICFEGQFDGGGEGARPESHDIS
jgi:hypothetical protein